MASLLSQIVGANLSTTNTVNEYLLHGAMPQSQRAALMAKIIALGFSLEGAIPFRFKESVYKNATSEVRVRVDLLSQNQESNSSA